MKTSLATAIRFAAYPSHYTIPPIPACATSFLIFPRSQCSATIKQLKGTLDNIGALGALKTPAWSTLLIPTVFVVAEEAKENTKSEVLAEMKKELDVVDKQLKNKAKQSRAGIKGMLEKLMGPGLGADSQESEYAF